MIVQDIFSDSIPALSIMDSAQRALYFMEFFRVSHLPIIDNSVFVGMISDEAIIDADKNGVLLKDYKLEKENCFIFQDQHIYDAILQMYLQKLSLIVVVDRDNNYLGTITNIDLINAFANIIALDQSGSTMVLKMGIRDYSLGEIAQIAESNHVKILSSYVESCKDQMNIRLTLRLNTNDLISLKASFERYNYTIESIFSENRVVDDMHKDRLDELMHYLNI